MTQQRSETPETQPVPEDQEQEAEVRAALQLTDETELPAGSAPYRPGVVL